MYLPRPRTANQKTWCEGSRMKTLSPPVQWTVNHTRSSSPHSRCTNNNLSGYKHGEHRRLSGRTDQRRSQPPTDESPSTFTLFPFLKCFFFFSDRDLCTKQELRTGDRRKDSHKHNLSAKVHTEDAGLWAGLWAGPWAGLTFKTQKTDQSCTIVFVVSVEGNDSALRSLFISFCLFHQTD